MMIRADMVWTKENVWRFMGHYSFQRTGRQRALLVVYFACMAVILAVGAIAWAVTGIFTMFIMVIIGVAMLLVYGAIFLVIMQNMANKVLKANAENGEIEVVLTAQYILLCRDGAPVGEVDWGKITELHAAKGFAYLLSEENAMILIDYRYIKEGTTGELEALFGEKNEAIKQAKLAKKA